MLETESHNDVWHVVALSLILAAALYILAGVLSSLSIDGASTRQRLEAISAFGGHVLTAGLVLAGVVVLLHLSRSADAARVRPLLIIALAIAGIVVLLTIFSVWDIITASAGDSRLLGATGKWQARLSGVLLVVAAGFMAIVAMVTANRAAAISGSRASASLPPS